MYEDVGSFEAFAQWCAATGHTALPADDPAVVGYLMATPARTAAQTQAYAGSLSAAHLTAGYPDPLSRPELAQIVHNLTHLSLPGE